VYEPRPRLFAGGDPRDRRAGGRGASVAAVVMLVLAGGAASVFCSFALPFASDDCADSDRRLICTAEGQRLVGVLPLAAAAVGIGLAVCSLALRLRFRGAGIALGYLVAFGGIAVALSIASR